MKRLAISQSGREIYGPKWQNFQGNEDNENRIQHAPVEPTENDRVIGIEAVEIELPIIAHHEDNKNQIQQGNRTGSGLNAEAMYRAALEGDWIAAEVILERDSTLAYGCVTEDGDRALHVAVAMKNKVFVEKLVQQMSPNDLALPDGRGYTACCYAAISGVVEIARVMIEKNPNLATIHDENNETPLLKAALHGNKEMASYFLRSLKIEHLLREEWFDLLLVTIRRQMFDVAIEIVRKDGSLATMENDEGTALHLLARQNISKLRSRWLSILFDVFDKNPYLDAIDPPFFNELAQNLWAEMQTRLEKPRLLQIIKEHHIAHDAAKTGHVKLVTMLIRTYPQLIWDTDSNGYTIFHIAVIYRQLHVFNLIHLVGVAINLSATSQDQDGNNILHLAAKLAPHDRVKTPQSDILMQRELIGFKQTEGTVPPSCAEMRNADGLTPRDLFSKERKSLLEYSKTWMRNTADSLILMATILLTMVFAATFNVPGGYEGQTGKPILAKKEGFKGFLAYEVIALAASVISIIMFRSIMASNFAEDDFLFKLPLQLLVGLEALFVSLYSAVLIFFLSFALVEGKTNRAIVWPAYYISIGFCFFWLIIEIRLILPSKNMRRKPNRLSRQRTLFGKK